MNAPNSVTSSRDVKDIFIQTAPEDSSFRTSDDRPVCTIDMMNKDDRVSERGEEKPREVR